MSDEKRKSLGITVTLSGDDLGKFHDIEKKFYVEKEAEILRMGLRFIHANYDRVQELQKLGVWDNFIVEQLKSLKSLDLLDEKSIDDLKKEITGLKERLAELEKKV